MKVVSPYEIPYDVFAVMVTIPATVSWTEYDSSTWPAIGLVILKGSGSCCRSVMDWIKVLELLEGSKFEFLGWKFHGTKFCANKF